MISSAGLYGKGRPSPVRAVEVAKTRGIYLNSHRSALVDRELVARHQLVIVMSAEQRRVMVEKYGAIRDEVVVLGDLDPYPIKTRTIEDPYGRPEEVFVASFARIDRCLQELVHTVARPIPVSAEG